MPILYALASIRTDWLNQVCIVLSWMAEQNVVTFAGLVLLWCMDKRWGYRYFFMSCMSQGFCRLLKGAAQTKRPYEMDSGFSYVEAAEKNAPGYSMPSGHCQGAVNAFGIYGLRYKKIPVRIISVVMILLVIFARMELGVHTLWDCLSGTAIAAVTMLLCNWLFEKADGRLPLLVAIVEIGLMILLGIVVFLLNVPQSTNFRPDVNQGCIKTTIGAIGAIIGVSIGFLIDRFWVHFETSAPWWGQFIKVAVGSALMILGQMALTALLEKLMPDSVLQKGIVNCILMALFTGIYPISFRLFKNWKIKTSDGKILKADA